MNQKKKPFNIYILVSIIIIFIMSFILLKFQNFSESIFLSNFIKKPNYVKPLPESETHSYLQQIQNLKNELQACNQEREILKKDRIKAAFILASNYRELTINILNLNNMLHNEINYEQILLKLREMIKDYENEEISKLLQIIEEYNTKFINQNTKSELIQISPRWVQKLIEKWVTIEKKESNQDRDKCKLEAINAIHKLNEFIATDEFVNMYLERKINIEK